MRSKKTQSLSIYVCIALSFFCFITFLSKQSNLEIYPNPHDIKCNPVALYEGEIDEDLSNVMVPIPMKDRIYNKTGIQCVWASLECIGRYAGEKKLYDLTSDKDCQGYSSPSSAAHKLKQLHVRFEQTTRTEDRSLIEKSVVKERRGVLFGIPGHAMVMVHYDKDKQIIKYINNSDKELKIRTWKMSEFDQRWDGWICAIYADYDIIAIRKMTTQMKIIDGNNYFLAPRNYILFPN